MDGSISMAEVEVVPGWRVVEQGGIDAGTVGVTMDQRHGRWLRVSSGVVGVGVGNRAALMQPFPGWCMDSGTDTQGGPSERAALGFVAESRWDSLEFGRFRKWFAVHSVRYLAALAGGGWIRATIHTLRAAGCGTRVAAQRAPSRQSISRVVPSPPDVTRPVKVAHGFRDG